MDTAGEVVNDLCEYLGLTDLPTTADYPQAMEQMKTLLARVSTCVCVCVSEHVCVCVCVCVSVCLCLGLMRQGMHLCCLCDCVRGTLLTNVCRYTRARVCLYVCLGAYLLLCANAYIQIARETRARERKKHRGSEQKHVCVCVCVCVCIGPRAERDSSQNERRHGR